METTKLFGSIFTPEFKIFKTGTTQEMVTINSKKGEPFNKSEKVKKYRELGYDVYDLNNTPIFN